MPEPKNIIEALLDIAGICVNGPAPWDITVNDPRFYPRVLKDKTLGLGESYMDGWWDCPRIDELICRLLRSGIEKHIKANWKLLWSVIAARLFNRQAKRRSTQVAERHYDLGNDLFTAFLDPYHQYSCAYFNGTTDLAEAQVMKMDLICMKLGLKPDDHLLDIGFGWGGLARFAAENYGCSVTGVNISGEQIRFARQSCQGLPVRVETCDYRDITDSYGKIVSVGMFEHVGVKNYRRFMKTVHRCLGSNGIFLLHTIGGNESRISVDPWINRYIFPNGMLPSMAQISRAVEGLFVLEDFHNLGPHYDKTLMAWNDNFQRAWAGLKKSYDRRFKRMWEYYLLTCAGAFRARDIQIWQMVFTHYGTKQPCCRYE